MFTGGGLKAKIRIPRVDWVAAVAHAKLNAWRVVCGFLE